MNKTLKECTDQQLIKELALRCKHLCVGIVKHSDFSFVYAARNGKIYMMKEEETIING